MVAHGKWACSQGRKKDYFWVLIPFLILNIGHVYIHLQGCKFSDYSLISDFFRINTSESYFQNFNFRVHLHDSMLNSDFE